MVGTLGFICFVFLAAFQSTDATPISIVQPAEGKVYQIGPFGSRVLKLAQRDVLADSPEAEETPENGLQVTRWPGNDKTANQDKKELLVPASSEGDATAVLFRRNRRAYEDRQFYHRRHDFDDDFDYAGYDRRHSLVGYMDDHDDFPTVVW